MKYIVSILLVLVLNTWIASAGVPDTVRVDDVIHGKNGSSANKRYVFLTEATDADVLNPVFYVDGTDKDFNMSKSLDIEGNKVSVGDGTNTGNKVFEANTAGGTKPYLAFDPVANTWVKSEDGVTESPIGTGGGGAGGNQALLNGEAESDTNDWSNTGGTFNIVDTGSQLKGLKSFQYDPVAQNDNAFQTVTLFAGLKGQSCEARLNYKGGSVDLTWRIKDANGLEIASLVLEATGDSSRVESLFFLCPSKADIDGDANKGILTYEIYQNSVADATSLIFDEAYLGRLIDLSDATLPDFMTMEISSTCSITKDDHLLLSSCVTGGTGICTCTYNNAFTVVPILGISTLHGNTTDMRSPRFSVSTITGFEFVAKNENNTNSAASSYMVGLTKQGVDAKQVVQVYKSIPKVSDFQNEMSFAITSAGAVDKDFYGAIASITNWATTAPVITFTSGFFLDSPTLVCNFRGTTASGVSNVAARNTTAALTNLEQKNGSGVQMVVNEAVSCIVSRHGIDIRSAVVTPVIVGQVVNSYAEGASKNIRVESCFITNSGTPTTADVACDTWIDSLTDIAVGRVGINITSGIFSDPPTCVISNSVAASCANFDGTTITNIYVKAATDICGGANADHNFHIICTGRR